MLNKRALLAAFEAAVQESDWSFLHLSQRREHPARYQVFHDNTGYRVRVYVWNLSHGGGARRPVHEYRIQITGIEGPSGALQFHPEIGGKTLILGWWDDVGVFAGFDYGFHSAPLGSSPSIQIGEAALHMAHTNGLAPHNRSNGELAIAFRPDFLGTYIDNLEALHKCGASSNEIEMLTRIAIDPAGVEDSSIEDVVARNRQSAVVTTKRALRDLDFRDRILTAYGHQCAICGIQLKLLDAAHILPVVHPGSTDETCNGVALCALHHRAYDRAFVTFDERFRERHNETAASSLKASGHDGGMASFTKALRPLLILPPDKKDRPCPSFVKESNRLRGW